jgi:uncharacterized protein (TIGR00255 family)
MTGFASDEGQFEDWRFSWDMRSVNGRGLDLRIRVPDWIDGLEPALRTALKGQVDRGNVTLALKINREASEGGVMLSPEGLSNAVEMVKAAEAAASAAGLDLMPARASDLLTMRGVLDSSVSIDDTTALKDALMTAVPGLIAAFNASRDTEGDALATILSGQIDHIEANVQEATAMAAARADKMRGAMTASLARVLENTDGVDEARLTQELAVIAVKADITEELDRLSAHVAAARNLLAGTGARGRKLDFLSQEFNREANTLCSKAQFAELTRIGLDLKHTIDQMREQIQNVE